MDSTKGGIHIEGAQIPWAIQPTSNGFWVGVCDALNITVQSGTWQELMEDIGTAIDMLLADLVETGNFERLLHDKGWSIEQSRESYESIEPRNLKFDVPFVPTLAEADTDGAKATLG